jgi:stage II sporulation protein AA (anti-sigma F factor antagonist)
MNIENLEFSFERGILTSKILGDIDHHSAKFVREKIDSYIIGCKPSLVLLDLSAVEFMDSSGLGLILGRYNTASEIGAEFRICSPSIGVKKVLELAGIERIIKIDGDLRV